MHHQAINGLGTPFNEAHASRPIYANLSAQCNFTRGL